MTNNNQSSELEGSEQKLDALFNQAAKVEDKYGISVSDTETVAAFEQVSRQTNFDNTPSWISISLLKYAAAAVILIGTIGIGYLLTPNQVSVPHGETRTITLSDQTTITLNSGSELRYPKWFNWWNRTLTLDGEAFFEVTQTGMPFQVEAGRGLITVMGTKFNVRSWSADTNTTSVFLREGQVSFSSDKQESEKVILEPGQFSQLSPQKDVPSSPKATDVSKATAWMHQGLAFEDQPLSAIFNELSRRFDINIKVNSKDVLDESLTLYLSEVKNAEQTLSDICRVKGLTYTQTKDTFVISESL